VMMATFCSEPMMSLPCGVAIVTTSASYDAVSGR
jgi:hypothetical protein